MVLTVRGPAGRVKGRNRLVINWYAVRTWML